jgi:20S proteasome alpha/beta subunit
MTKDEALKLALEALEYASDRVFCENNDDLIASAITAITQTLATPVQEEDLYDLAVKADNWGQP